MTHSLKTSIIGLLLLGTVSIIHSCKKVADASLPTLTTSTISNITGTSATSGGTIIREGSGTIVSRGVCWSTGTTPTINDSKTSDGAGAGSFTSSITGLNVDSTYFVRAYAINNSGVGYGMTMSFKTIYALIDIDGNGYNIVTIGNQTWMKENLKTTKYCNGDLIGTTTPATLTISGEIAPKYQWAFDGNESNAVTYGRLYTFYAVIDNRKICPTGWHVPTNNEWTILTDYLGGASVAGGKLKETGNAHWASPNTGATNESEFTAIGGGRRLDTGAFIDFSYCGNWWSSSIITILQQPVDEGREVYNNVTKVLGGEGNGGFVLSCGISVRCIKD
jgi:uncharacterized protein (TIGR02145 family)